jgi:hypothetical protein
MQDQVNGTTTPHKRVPWNKGKVTGAKRHYDPNTSGRSGRNSRSKAALGTLPCSI